MATIRAVGVTLVKGNLSPDDETEKGAVMVKKILKIMALLVVGLVALVALLVVEENMRGKAAWERHLRELEAKGDTLDILKLVPPPVPDAQNIAAAPIFAELMTVSNKDQSRLVSTLKKVLPRKLPSDAWTLPDQRVDWAKLHAAFSNQNILTMLQPAEGVLQEAAEALERPQCRFPLQYEKGLACLVPQLTGTHALMRTWQVRALGELEAGQTEAAFKDVHLMLRLVSATENEPLLILLLCRVFYLNLALQPVREGLAAQRWTDTQLRDLQEILSSIQLLSHLDLALHAERCMANCGLDEWLKHPSELFNLETLPGDDRDGGYNNWAARLIPTSIVYFNCLNVDLFYQRYILGCVDSRAGLISPSRAETFKIACEEGLEHRHPYHVLEAILTPFLHEVLVKIGVAQTMVESAALACAVERYRLANGKLPEKLDALVPQFIAQVPHDVIDGQPLRYRLDGTDGFVIYSIGWNQKDDGGQQVLTKEAKPQLDFKQGDWVWHSKPISR